MKKWLFALILTVLYLLFWPVPIDPEVWHPGDDPGLEGPYALNDRLDSPDVVAEDVCFHCEDIEFGPDGYVYAGTEEGRILRFTPDYSGHVTLAVTGGRPLGLAIDSSGTVYAADATRGLLKVDANGRMTVLADSFEGRPFVFLNNVILGPGNELFFTESSSRFTYEHRSRDVLSHRPNGSLFRYDLQTGATELVLDSLYFANGVALWPDATSLLVSDMNNYRILRHWISGPDAGRTAVFVDHLPGYPDNLHVADDGTVWVGVPTLRIRALDLLMPYPFLRKIILRLPMSTAPKTDHAMVLGFSGDGTLQHNLQGERAVYTGITGATPRDGMLSLGTISERGIARVPIQ